MKSLIMKANNRKTLALAISLALVFFAQAFAQNRLYFSPANIYPILNTDVVGTSAYLQVTSTTGVKSYGADVYDQSIGLGEQYPNNKLYVITNIWTPTIPLITVMNKGNPTDKLGHRTRVYEGQDTDSVPPYTTFSNTSIGHLFVTNTGMRYLTSAYIRFYTGINHVTKIFVNGDVNKEYDIISGLNIYFWACPAVKDMVSPTFPNNSINININPEFPNRQINRQYENEFGWIFGLLDNSITLAGSTNGREGEPDFTGGTNFRPRANNPTYSGGITNQNGINSGSFRLEIKVATGRDHSLPQNGWTSWNTSVLYTSTSTGVNLTPRGKTRRWLDKNYTGQINLSEIPEFLTEQLVMISGYVEDRDMGYPGFNGTQTWDQIKGYSYRSGKNSTNFIYYFNQGMRPWYSSTMQGTYTHTGACVLDLDRYQTGYTVRTITGYLHDDRAGIDTGSVQIIITGTIGGIQTGKIYPVGSNITLTNFSFTGNGCRIDSTSTTSCTPTVNSCGNTSSTYPGNGTTEVCDDGTKASTGNYRMIFSDLTRTYDPETPLYVAIVYRDNVGKQGWPVACSWGVKKQPRFVWFNNILNIINSLFAQKISLSNYPKGAQIQPINIQLQDEWAGVDSGSIAGAVSGYTLNLGGNDIDPVSINLAYTSTLYTQVSGTDLRQGFDTYPNVSYGLTNNLWNGTTRTDYIDRLLNPITNIHSRQKINYALLFAQTGSYSSFTGYFAPEHPINLTLSFNDLEGASVYNPINLTYTNNAAPQFWEHTKTTDFTGGTDYLVSSTTPVGIYLTGEMARLFSGDVDMRRIFPYDLTGDNYSEIGTIKQTNIAFKVTDNRAGVDSGNVIVTITGQRRGQPYTYIFTANKLDFSGFDREDEGGWNMLNYLVQLHNHNIYFDRQSRGGSAPVPGRESRYTITLYAQDLKKPTPNTTSISFTRDMENLSCKFLDRCNARLYFTYDYLDGSGVVPVVATGVHPFLGQTLYVIASGNQIIYTGVNENYIACNGAGILSSPIQIAFQAGLLAGGETNPYTNYQHSELIVMDGMFELSGDILVIK